MDLPDGLTSEIGREMKLKKKPDKGALFLAVVFEYFLFIVLAGFDFPDGYTFILPTHILYLSLIIYIVLSSKIDRFRDNFSQVLPYFTFLFFMPMQGFITNYGYISGVPPLHTIIMPLLTLLTLMSETWDLVSTKKLFAFMFLYLLSIVLIAWGMLHIMLILNPYYDGPSCSFFRGWYPLMLYTGIFALHNPDVQKGHHKEPDIHFRCV